MITEVITVHGPLKQPRSGSLRKLPPSSGISYYCHDVYMLIFPFLATLTTLSWSARKK